MQYDVAKAAVTRLGFALARKLKPQGVTALSADPAVMDRAGQPLKVGELAQEYGFEDIDGSQPKPYSIPEGFGE